MSVAPSAAAPSAPSSDHLAKRSCVHGVIADCTKKCDSRDARSCTRLGETYEFGNAHIAEDAPKAAALYERACDANDGLGCRRLATAYDLGLGKPTDKAKATSLIEKAIPLLRKACESGDGASCTDMATLHLTGDGVPKDNVLVAEFRRKAADAFAKGCVEGDPTACAQHGMSLLGKDDYASGAIALQKACTGGEGMSCHLLGAMYDEGKGVRVDKEKAATLFKRSCDAGIRAGCNR